VLHRFETSYHGFDPRPDLLILLKQTGPFFGQHILTLPQRTVLLAKLVADREEFVETLLETLQFVRECLMCLFSHALNIVMHAGPVNRLSHGSGQPGRHGASIPVQSGDVMECTMSNTAEAPGEGHARLERTLIAVGAPCDAAEAHGTLSSLICLHGSRAGRYWLDAMLEEEPPAAPTGAEDALLSLAMETAGQLEDPDFTFGPLLPDDGEPLTDRVEAIALWAQGFLHGLGEAGRRSGLAARLQEEPLAELMEDLTEITRAAVGEDEEGAEQDEQAYAELVEYLRVAAQLFYLELAPLRSDRHGAPAGLQ
jgi:uncharacterized protein YgfB (UPF0149 family)